MAREYTNEEKRTIAAWLDITRDFIFLIEDKNFDYEKASEAIDKAIDIICPGFEPEYADEEGEIE